MTIDIGKNSISYGSTYQGLSVEPLVVFLAFRYLHYSVTVPSQGSNQFPGVCSDLDLTD